MLIIPAIDLRGGRCVRLIQGDYAQERQYEGDPVEVAKQFMEDGASLIHVVDLEGAKTGEPQNLSVIERLAAIAPIEVGGGVRTLATARTLLDMGVKRVVVGTKLVQDELLAAEFFHQLGDQVVAGIDARGGLVATHGWLEDSTLPATELAQRIERQGGTRIILTDIARDGMFSGPNTEMLQQVMAHVTIPVIASGGVGALRDLETLLSLRTPPEGIIIGRAIYEGRVSVKEALSLTK